MDAASLIFPVLLLVAFYFLIIRPARTRQRAVLQLQERLAPGVEVLTTSGIFATVRAVEDSAVTLEVAPGVTLRFAKAAVGQILDAGDDDGIEDDIDGDIDGDSAETSHPGDESPRDDRPTR
ncbi:MAG TPA: preprotein translocase subunit YajC [Actinomycetes bacterium]